MTGNDGTQQPIEIEDLSWRYLGEDEPALDGIDLRVEEGQVIGVVGANEHGKTTLLKAISGMIPRSSDGIKDGEVRLYGERVEDYSARELASTVGFVFSDPELQFTMMNVTDEIVFGLENLGLPVEEIDERLRAVAEKVGIEELMEKSPLELSGGQKQRVALASVIAMQPEIYVLDEPTNMLDPYGKAQVFEIIEEVIAEDRTVVIAEHDLEYLAPIADELLMMRDGQVVRRTDPKTFFEELTDEELQSLFPPEVTMFARQLHEAGYPVEELPLSIDDGLALCKRVATQEEVWKR